MNSFLLCTSYFLLSTTFLSSGDFFLSVMNLLCQGLVVMFTSPQMFSLHYSILYRRSFRIMWRVTWQISDQVQLMSSLVASQRACQDLSIKDQTVNISRFVHLPKVLNSSIVTHKKPWTILNSMCMEVFQLTFIDKKR